MRLVELAVELVARTGHWEYAEPDCKAAVVVFVVGFACVAEGARTSGCG